MSRPAQILRAVASDGRVLRRVGTGNYHVTGKAMPQAVKAVASIPAKKSTTAYSAALVNRLTEDWPIAVLSADAATRFSLRQLRARARDLERNGGIHSAYLSAVESNVIGSKGIGVQMKIPVKTVTGRVVSDPGERNFLKALEFKAERFTSLASGKRKRAYLREQDPVWQSALVQAVRSIKADGALYTEVDGVMTASASMIDRYACFVVEQEWKDFSKRGNCDVTGKHSLMDFCRLALRTSVRDGDALILVYLGYPNRWGVAFQLIEGDYLDDWYNVDRLPNGNKIRMGVELDPFGRKVAFWVFAHHPGDYGVEGVSGYDGRRRRIAALGCDPDRYYTDGSPESVQCIHVTKSKRAEETRAVPWITPAMSLIHNIEAYKEAEITAARAEACKHVMYERDAFTSDGTMLDWENVNGQLTDELQPGGASELPPGVHANYLDPKHPNANMPDFLKSMKREVAMAVNYCYNTLFGDLESVNYSSIRAGTLNEREASKMDQAWFGDDAFGPMFEIFLRMGLLYGAIPFGLAEFNRLNAPEFKFRRWQWVDPRNDAETAVLLIENKLRTRAQIIADMSSDDFEETIDELDYEAGYIASKANLQPAIEDPEKPAISEEEKRATKALAAFGRLLATRKSRGEEFKALLSPAAIKSAFLGDAQVSELPQSVQATIAQFAASSPASKIIRYQMTVPELICKADQHNLETARDHVQKMGVAESANEVGERPDKFILVLNDRIIDGHHHLAKAERGKITRSLPVVDLTPLRYQTLAN